MVEHISATKWRSIANLWGELGEISNHDVEKACQHASRGICSLVGGSNVLMVIHQRLGPVSSPLRGIRALFSREDHSDFIYRRHAMIDWTRYFGADDAILNRLADTEGSYRAFGHRRTLEQTSRTRHNSTLNLFDRLDIVDRASAIVPLGCGVEVSYCIDRVGSDVPFSAHDEQIISACAQGLRPLAARLALSRGLMNGQQRLTDVEAKFVDALLSSKTSDEIAEEHRITVARLHCIEDEIYRKLAVPHRLGLLHVWLKGHSPATATHRREPTSGVSALQSAPTHRDCVIVTRVREALNQAIGNNDYKIETIARRLGASVRSLQRGLADADTSYSELADRARRQRAAKLLGDSELSITEIALQLGFGQASSLSRAVRRWTDQTPTAWRRELREDG